MELYTKMTDYDILVFIFFWCDLAQQLAFVQSTMIYYTIEQMNSVLGDSVFQIT